MGNKKLKSLEAVLKKPKVSVEEVMDVDSILNKARTGDVALQEYLQNPDILMELLSKLVETADNLGRTLRYPFISCELLMLQLDVLIEVLQQDPGWFELIWEFMQTNDKIDPQGFVYITRILAALFAKNSKVMMAVFKARGDVLDLFIKHLDNTPCADFLCRLIEMESSTLKVLQWLGEEGFFSKLMQTIGPSYPESKHFALYQFVNGLLMRAFPETYPIVSLLHRFTDPSIFGNFLSLMMNASSSSSSWLQGVGVLSSICIKIHEVTDAGLSTNHVVHELVSCLVPHVQRIVAILDEDFGCYNGAAGKMSRVGLGRIKATRLLADLVLLRSAELVAEFKRLQVAEKLFALFFASSQNNFLHTNVVDFFAHLCQGDWTMNRPIIIESIIRGSRLLDRIKQAQKIADSFAEMPRRPRPNFMGHITLLSDQIHNLMDRHGAELYKEIGDLLRKETWIEYSNKSYRETKLKDAYVLGGEQAPPAQPVPNEDVFSSVFTSGADETIVRYFCHEIISNFPPNLHLGDLDAIMFSEQDDEDDADEMMEDAPEIQSIQGILGGTIFGNRGVGFENIMAMELELRMSGLDDDDFDLGPDSDDENIFAT